ncbi:flagellar hook-length control protein FliK [Bosea sp. (in: a-proteobacteria)]|uniref:flagellar hook-length control protein FliK n=1 Tax=Bosea sp. (in: a-proteobacteria) TaxID=1871050 RepID=UPI002B46DA5D|nr:flagellar hook-length control protein FliK [Bosea sp. (in: a-proteobacteria)]WRH59896.1 MAG: flagellar hook-length control protein FliK [Bosea sp. (in: a-proteobacteria)]
MNLATLAQSQTLATLLQALAPTTGLVAGRTVEARLLSVAGDGTATAQLGQETFALVLAGPAARQSALQPGATLVLKLDPGPAGAPGGSLTATLVEVRPPTPEQARAAAATAQSMQPSGAASTTAPGLTPPSQATQAQGTQAQGTQVQATPAQPAPPQTPAAAMPGRLAAPAANPTAPGTTGPAATPGVGPVPGQSASAAGAAARADLAAGATSPRAMAGPLLGPALARQDSLAPLLANLRAVANGAVALTLPRPLLALADRVLARALPVERKALTGPLLQAAVQTSGLFLEANRAQGMPAPPQADLKGALQTLRDHLLPLAQAASSPEAGRAGSLPASSAASAQTPGGDVAAKPTPPRRDGAPVPQPIAEPTLSAGDKPLTVVGTLLEQTQSAIDRITLSQYASLPAEGTRPEAQQGQRWLTEIPLAFHNGAAMLPLQIEREPPRREVDAAAGPLWRVRFALDVEPLGPLQGIVTLQGRSVGVTLWAEREDTSRLLRGASTGLEAALADARFENRAIAIHTGQPRIAQPTAGQFLDRMS